jgi:hypothetical protein
MKPILALLTIAAVAVTPACTTVTDPATGKKQIASTLTVDQRKALLTDATTLAGLVAGIYGGPAAAAGLNALGAVAQGYVGKIIPSAVVAATPGISNMGTTVAPALSPTQPVTQADVNAIFAAAQQAANAPSK